MSMNLKKMEKWLKMKLKEINEIKSQEEARQIAIEFQEWSSNQDLSYSELNDYSDYFEILGNRFNLIDEFKENGII